jgi:hypothetical protein
MAAPVVQTAKTPVTATGTQIKFLSKRENNDQILKSSQTVKRLDINPASTKNVLTLKVKKTRVKDDAVLQSNPEPKSKDLEKPNETKHVKTLSKVQTVS